MAIKKQYATINGKCMERVLVIPPGEENWIAHPTRGTFKPCGTYPRTSGNGTPTIGSQPMNIKTRTKSKPVELDFEQSRNPFMLERYLPGSEPKPETKESSYQWLFFAAMVAAIVWLLNKY